MRVDWIPVAEGLPDGSDDVLVTVQRPDEGDDLFVLVGWWNPIFKDWAVYDEGWEKLLYNVIAWAPLPEPYERRQRVGHCRGTGGVDRSSKKHTKRTIQRNCSGRSHSKHRARCIFRGTAARRGYLQTIA